MPKKRQPSNAGFKAALVAGNQMAKSDILSVARSETERNQRSLVALDEIKDRKVDTRDINQKHVAQLAESIGELGLLEPLVVDSRLRLLAGGHRLAAMQQLIQEDPDKYAQQFPDRLIPVRVMPFDADEEPDRALQCEVAENEKRRDYTSKEVRSLAERLLESGYIQRKGRLKEGEKALVPALRVIVGKSRATVMRYLSESNLDTEGKTLNVSHETFRTKSKYLNNAWSQLKHFQKLHVDVAPEELPAKQAMLVKKLPRFLNLLEDVLVEMDKSKTQQ